MCFNGYINSFKTVYIKLLRISYNFSKEPKGSFFAFYIKENLHSFGILKQT